MRISTRLPLLGFAFCVCLMASSVLVTVFRVSPADSQTFMPYWDPDTVQVLESERQVVLTLRKSGPGHVHYQTEDRTARAPDDYGAVSGDEIFTTGGSESKTIRIPIVDDNLDEASEAFSVLAHEGDRRGGGWTGHVGTVWILDDDRPNKSSGSSSSSGQSNPQAAGPQTGSLTRPALPPATIPSSSESTVAGTQSGVANPSDPNQAGAADPREEATPIAAKTVQKDKFLPMASLGVLLLVIIAAAGFALKRRLRHKAT